MMRQSHIRRIGSIVRHMMAERPQATGRRVIININIPL